MAAQPRRTIHKEAARDMLTSTLLRKATAGKPSNAESRAFLDDLLGPFRVISDLTKGPSKIKVSA